MFNVDTVMRLRAIAHRRTLRTRNANERAADIDAHRALVLENRGTSASETRAFMSTVHHDRDLFNFAAEVYQASK